MEIRLGPVQVIKAIDDGGISIYFRRDFGSDQISRRSILSVEVSPSASILIYLGKEKKARQGERRTNRESSCGADIRSNVRSSMSF